MEQLKEQLKHFYIFGSSAHRDWKRLLIAATCVTIGIAVWGYLFFQDIQNSTESVNFAIGQVTLSGRTKGDELKDLVARYEARNKQFSAILKISNGPVNSTSSSATSTSGGAAGAASSSVSQNQ